MDELAKLSVNIMLGYVDQEFHPRSIGFIAAVHRGEIPVRVYGVIGSIVRNE
jgi:hypothetical protein